MSKPGLVTLPRIVKGFIHVFFGAGLLWGVCLLGGMALSLRYADDLAKFTLFPLKIDNLYEIDQPRAGAAPPVVETRDGSARLELDTVYGSYRYRRIPRLVVGTLYLGLFLSLGLYFVVVIQLANLFEHFSEGRFFEAGSPRCLFRAGWALLLAGLLNPGFKLLVLWTFQGSIAVEGASLPWAFLASEVRPEIVLAGLVLLVLAEAFRRGVSLREEQDLTV
ncbi:MAG: DUF2975 domain-containing protein [Acidobacteria bacterium]|nr:DUF2975 domain-containing protein [Acidobacteriota bacterium]